MGFRIARCDGKSHRLASGLRRLLIAGLASLAAGCAGLDGFTDRATGFNRQVADVQDQTLLLNIMRAAYRKPMHFTELTTLSGTSEVSSGLSLAFPFAGIHGGTGTPSFGAKQSPTFNVAVLETQEFYEGVMKPLDPNQMQLYLNQGVQPSMLFTLMLQSIVVGPTTHDRCERIENNFHPRTEQCLGPGKDQIEQVLFKQALDALIKRGLTIAPEHGAERVAPPLPAAAAQTPKLLKELVTQKLDAVYVDAAECMKADSDVCPDGLDKLPADERDFIKRNLAYYRVTKPVEGYRFCFGPDAPSAIDKQKLGPGSAEEKILLTPIKDEARCDYKPGKAKSKAGNGAATPAMAFAFSGKDSKPQNDKDTLPIELIPRSTEGVIYFLGEVARWELCLGDNNSSSGSQTDATSGGRANTCIPAKRPPPMVKVDYRSEEDVLFKVRPAGTPPVEPTKRGQTEISVDYEKERYVIDIDPSAADRSGAVLRIAAQLLALHRAAKDFPLPATIPLLR